MSNNERAVKIVYVGAGSAAWAITIVRDLIVSKDLSNIELVFVDIDEDKLKNTTKLAKRYNEITGGKLKISMNDRLDKALIDADFVINSVLAGKGHSLQEKVRKVSEDLGYYRGIESREFNMVSDYATLYAATDQYQYISDLVNKLHDIAPDAWLFNVSNPMFELQTLILRKNMTKSVSYCDGTLHALDIAKFFGANPPNVHLQMAGINHNIWLTEFSIDGEDQYPKIDDWVKNHSESYYRNDKFYNTYDPNIDIHDISQHVQFSKVAVDMYQNFGLFPVGDTVRSGTWKYHYDLETKKRWYGPYGGFDSEIGWKKYLDHIAINNNKLRDLSEMDKGTILNEIPPKMGDDPVVPFIVAILFDKKTRAHLDIRNMNVDEKIIPYLPENVAVEVPVSIDRHGIHPEKVVNLNERIIKEVLLPRTVNMEIALDAFNTGSRDVLLNALYLDPRTRSDEQAEETLERVLNLPENASAAKLFR
ncbi:MAG: alpha-glucosidase/alpha-galactosidase [Candidatus Geothermarchaeota archaeon]